ncbi:MAG: glycosyltransferase [Bryobacteraceae bacterium]
MTDDPWNRAHRAAWFLEALREYDHVFSPRRANLDDLRGATSGHVEYLPFAYDPALFFEPRGRADHGDDVIFAGGGDADRVPYIAALSKAGFRVGLYGGYWDRYPETRGLTRGMVDPAQLREVIASAKIALCLVRKANRDGHCMRTFEVPAVGACMLVEDTDEHRELLGPDMAAVAYFRSLDEMVVRAAHLIGNYALRARLAAASKALVASGRHTYKDRLCEIAEVLGCG